MGTKPSPVGIQAPLLKAAKRITRIAKTEIATLAIKTKARIFSTKDKDVAVLGRFSAFAEFAFLVILLGYLQS